jgi:AraC-like DNA-binding protein
MHDNASIRHASFLSFTPPLCEAFERSLEQVHVDTQELDESSRHAPGTRFRGGLAPWQVRRVTAYIETHLNAPIVIKDLAAIARLSAYHFCRAFRESFRDSPHGYLMRRRVGRAQTLMAQTEVSLSHVAADCGLSDQAHLNRLFRRFVGESPGAWRRARTNANARSPRANESRTSNWTLGNDDP